MILLWDEPKRISNLAKHGLDFADIKADFDFRTALVTSAKSGRTMLLGLFKGEIIVVIISAALGTEATAIICLRRANRRERRLYGR
jgi:uncharacterized DUF497 family protein